jgi:photosystem II stability/assembly factor-like uncharacterized protein
MAHPHRCAEPSGSRGRIRGPSRQALAAAVSLAVVLAATGTPATARPSATATPVWSTHGTPEPMVSVAVDPTDAMTAYASGEMSVYRTADGGRSWQVLSLPDGAAWVKEWAVDPSDPSVVYAAGGGLFKSTDGGRTWTAADQGLPASANDGLALAPSSPSTLFASSWGDIYRSIDGGGHWRKVAATYSDWVSDIEVDPTDPSIAYASTYGCVDFAACGVLKTTDGGRTWTTSLFGHDPEDLAIDPSSPGTVYASTTDGVFRSTDGGATWTFLTDQVRAGGIDVDPRRPQVVCAVSLIGRAWLSEDGGEHWRQVSRLLEGTAVAFAPSDPDVAYASDFAGGGVFRSDDGGGTWALAQDGISGGSISSVAAVPGTARSAYATAIGLYQTPLLTVWRTDDRGRSWRPVMGGLPLGRKAAQVLTQPGEPDLAYASMSGPGGVYRTDDGGGHWVAASHGLPDGMKTLALDPAHPGTLYAGIQSGDGVWRSTDGGRTWAEVAPGLPSAAWLALAVVPTRPPTILASIDPYIDGDRAVYRWTGEGPWEIVQTVSCFALALDPASPTTVWAGVGVEGESPIRRSTDAGATWEPVGDLSDADAPLAIAFDTRRPGTILVGTAHGVYRSADGGAHWTPANRGLLPGHRWITSLAIAPGQGAIYAGTQSAGVEVSALP